MSNFDYEDINSISGQRMDLFVLSGSVVQHDICCLKEDHIFHLHSHPFYEFLIVLEGSVVISTDDGINTTASAGEIAFIPRKFRHIISAAKDSPEFKLIRFNCSYNSYSEETIKRIIHLDSLKHCINDERKLINNIEAIKEVRVVKDEMGCINQIEHIITAINNRYIGSYIVLSNNACNLFVAAVESFYPNKVADDFEFVVSKTTEVLNNKAVWISNYIDSHCHEKLSIESIAASMNYSKRQIQRIIQNYYGVSVSDLIKRCRVDKIKQHIQNYPDSKSEELLAISGYSDHRTMNSKFKELTGFSTAQYTHMIKKGAETIE